MSDELKIPEGLQVAFGLQAQGHIALILHKLADAGNWDDIGKAIGWHPETARRHFEWWIDAQTRATPAPAPAPIPHANIIEPMRAIAKRHGWALGVHGSLVRDIDLIAVPWTREASDWTAVYDAWLAELPLQDTEGAYRDRPPHRPHNRKSMLILQRDCVRVDDGNSKGTWNPPCLDVSFMIPLKALAPVTVSNEMVAHTCKAYDRNRQFEWNDCADEKAMRAALEAYESARGACK